MSPGNLSLHPGPFIRKRILPKGITIAKAAENLGVSRPTLSNLLNGKAALSTEMAKRLEQVFGASRGELLQMQAAYDEQVLTLNERSRKPIAYVPPFLAIRANDISAWAKGIIDARNRLAVLLRVLINSTTDHLSRVDFPGNDDAERPGWDGETESDGGSPWVPAGSSGWEFSCAGDFPGKPNRDYEKNLKAPRATRLNTTFVFVTPHRWPGKTAWIADKRREKRWKDVRAYDASDMEQWLEQSLPGQAWFTDEIGGASGVRSLDRCWRDWADVASPPLPASLFQPALDAAGKLLSDRLLHPSPNATVIMADSIEEGLAFVAQALGPAGDPRLTALRDQTLVFDSPEAMRKLADSTRPFVAVIHSNEVERAVPAQASKFNRILIHPRNAHVQPHITLEPIGYDVLRESLKERGLSIDEVDKLARESGRSLTVLRRRLAESRTIQRPEWAAKNELAKKLVPLMMVGAWNVANGADLEALAALSGCTAEALEEHCQELAQLNDAPIWIADTYRGVVSKLDALFAVHGHITSQMLERYFVLARRVLGEDDPSLDLEEDRRAFANLYGKSRVFSKAFREGVSETLVLLTLNADLLRSRGLNPDQDAYRLFDALFESPLTTRKLLASSADLRTYAEAVPERFLELIENDLKRPKPAVLGLLKPMDPASFGVSPGRTDLLWALEGLAWNPNFLPRVVSILARLSEVEINDNWVNKPENSLRGIFRSWMPQTEASPASRVTLLRHLKLRFPGVAWRICLAQIGREQMSASVSYKPRWRSDGYGYGQPVETWEPILAFEAEMLKLALDWGGYTVRQICDLVEKLPALTEEDQTRVWSIIERWGRESATEVEKAQIVERIRVTTQTLRARRRVKDGPALVRLRAQATTAMEALQPSDSLHRSLWLFAQHWVLESADELELDIETINYEEREERIRCYRIAALEAIMEWHGTGGLIELALRAKTPWLVGQIAPSALPQTNKLVSVVHDAFARSQANEDEAASLLEFIAGLVQASWEHSVHRSLLDVVLAEYSPTAAVTFLLRAPFDPRTWALVDGLPPDDAKRYWSEVRPFPGVGNFEHALEGASRLLHAQRPRAAFAYIHHHLKEVDSQFLAHLLNEMAESADDGSFPLEGYAIEQAFKRIGCSSALSLDEKAQLEFRYLEALVGYGDRPRDPGIPHLECYIETHPELFVQMICWIFKRADSGKDPAAYDLSTANKSGLAQRAYRLLQALRRLPGCDDAGVVSAERLRDWIRVVLDACDELGRLQSAECQIGELLANAPSDPDGVWPCQPVREVLEELQAREVMRGVRIGRYNARGVYWRGEGGAQEREIAEQYDDWGAAVEATHPYVAAELLRAMAKGYRGDADREDRDATVRKRLV